MIPGGIATGTSGRARIAHGSGRHDPWRDRNAMTEWRDLRRITSRHDTWRDRNAVSASLWAALSSVVMIPGGIATRPGRRARRAGRVVMIPGGIATAAGQ